jgi:hypothetical protein
MPQAIPTTAPPSNPVGAFLWGSNGQQLTPQQAQQRQAMAAAMAAQMGTPNNVGEGLSAIGKAIMARDMMNQSDTAISSGQAGANAKFAALGPGASMQDLMGAAADPWMNSGEQSALAPRISSASDLATPQGQIALETSKAVLGYKQRQAATGIYGDDAHSQALSSIVWANANGQTGTPAYAAIYNELFGPKDVTSMGPDGNPIVTHTVPSIPQGVAPPGYTPSQGSSSVAPTPAAGANPVPSAPAAATAAAPTSSANPAAPGVADDPASAGQTIKTAPGPGSTVTQFGNTTSRQQFAANRAMTVSAPALKSLHENMAALGDIQNRIALQSGEWGKFLASDGGKKALDSIAAIADTVAAAQGVAPKAIMDELTPLSTDTPQMRRYRLDRADEYVRGLSSGYDTAGATAAVKDAVNTPPGGDAPPAEGAPLPVFNTPQEALASGLKPGTKFKTGDGRILAMPAGRPQVAP